MTVIKGKLEEFNYPNKGKNIPPPRMGDEMMEEQMMGDGQMMEGEQEMQLYDEEGNPQKFFDQNGNEIPFEEVKKLFLMEQQQQ